MLGSVFSKTEKHKVLVVDKIERQRDGTNSSYESIFNGFVGLSKFKDSNNVPYGEYLKNRKIIPANTIAIELTTESFSRLNYTLGVYNKSASSAPLLLKKN